MKIAIYVAAIVAVALAVLWAITALAQDHAAGHSEYRKWSSQKTGNCCDNKDCHPLADDQWRETARGIEVLVRYKSGAALNPVVSEIWCPVLQEHFIVTGKSPDASVAHACIWGSSPYSVGATTENPCELLRCFVGPSKS